MPASGGKDRERVSEQELLDAVIAGEEAARGRFFEKFRPLVRWAMDVTFRRYERPLLEEDALDLVHDVFLMLFLDDARRLRQYDGRNGATFATWLRVVATRYAIDRLRRPQREVLVDDLHALPDDARAGDGLSTTEEQGPEGQALAGDTASRLREVVAELRPRDRLFVQLHYVQGLPIDEVARLMGTARNAAYVRKMRLHRRLRGLLEARYGDAL